MEIIVDRSLCMTRAAVTEDGQLVEIHEEREGGMNQTESLFYGRVQSIRASISAAFVDIGQEKNAFLPLREGSTLRCGDELIVQGEAEPSTPTKGLRVTDRVTLAGRHLVLIAGGQGVFLSKKVKGERRREALKAMGKEICPSGCGLILRTSCQELSKQELREEAQTLAGRWHDICRKAAGQRKPGLLQARETLVMRLLRELSGKPLSRVIVNDETCFHQLLQARAQGQIPEKVPVEFFDEQAKGLLLFDVFSLEKQIDEALSRRVWLPCGGYLVIDPCEAMTVIDVNSGKMVRGQDAEEAALRVNLEAADRIARLLRLRDIGGIIVVDFIDMARADHREMLLARMREAAAHDRSPVTVEGITRLGLMEMTRRRGDDGLCGLMCAPCACCGGQGWLLSPEETARRALRDLRRKAISGQRGPFLIRCGGQCAQALLRMDNPVDAPVYVQAVHGHSVTRIEIEQLGEGRAPEDGAVPLPERTDR